MVLTDRLRLDVNLPVVVYQQGTGLILNDQTYSAPRTRGWATFAWGPTCACLAKAAGDSLRPLGSRYSLPTGKASAFTGDGHWRFWPRVLLAGNVRTFSWAARLGYHIRPTRAIVRWRPATS